MNIGGNDSCSSYFWLRYVFAWVSWGMPIGFFVIGRPGLRRGFFVEAQNVEERRGFGEVGLGGCQSVVPGGGIFAGGWGEVPGLMEPVCCGGDVFATDYEAEAVAVCGQTFGAAVFCELERDQEQYEVIDRARLRLFESRLSCSCW